MEMAIKLFESPHGTFVQKPFLKEWIEKNPSAIGKPCLITKVRLSKKGTGYLVETEDFNCFLWVNARNTKSFVEAITHYSELGEGPSFVVVPDKNGESQLGIDDEIQCFFSWNGGTWLISLLPTEPLPEKSLAPLNPFLSAAYPLPSESSSGKKTSSQRPSKAS